VRPLFERWGVKAARVTSNRKIKFQCLQTLEEGAHARNTGLTRANGDYLAFLDADDRLLSGALATNLGLFAKEPGCGFVYGSYRYINEEGAIICSFRRELIAAHCQILKRRGAGLKQMSLGSNA
jgi:glycosyltransferase involved in cell wall biosynthesis